MATSITAHVTSWNIEFVADDGETITNILIDLDKIYPGMERYEKEINVRNKGEVSAKLDYEIESIEILGEKFEVDENTTSEDLENKIEQEYPFKIIVNLDDSNLIGENGVGKVKVIVEWPFESGNDELDTNWGNKAYEYYTNNTDKPSLLIKMVLIATQQN